MSPEFNLSVLEDLANHDAAKVRKYALLSIQSLEEVLAKIDDAIVRRDISQLGAMGHRAKSTALNIGATEFARQCLLLEQAGHAGDGATALAIAHDLRDLFVPIHTAINAHLTS
jgi:HPt (histidine-containing phosphotransfer) domain-containing protein